MNDKNKWTCENCGAENEAGTDACSECGWDKFADSEEDYVGYPIGYDYD
jgi:ribosomal protein L37E